MLREETDTYRKTKNNRNMARRRPKTQQESRGNGPKKKEGTGPKNSKHISKGMVLQNKHQSNGAASN